MTKTKEIIKSFSDAMIFGTCTIGPVMVFLWAIGFIQFNI
jgi:hypothetical protein